MNKKLLQLIIPATIIVVGGAILIFNNSGSFSETRKNANELKKAFLNSIDETSIVGNISAVFPVKTTNGNREDIELTLDYNQIAFSEERTFNSTFNLNLDLPEKGKNVITNEILSGADNIELAIELRILDKDFFFKVDLGAKEKLLKNFPFVPNSVFNKWVKINEDEVKNFLTELSKIENIEIGAKDLKEYSFIEEFFNSLDYFYKDINPKLFKSIIKTVDSDSYLYDVEFDFDVLAHFADIKFKEAINVKDVALLSDEKEREEEVDRQLKKTRKSIKEIFNFLANADYDHSIKVKNEKVTSQSIIIKSKEGAPNSFNLNISQIYTSVGALELNNIIVPENSITIEELVKIIQTAFVSFYTSLTTLEQ